MARVCGGVAPQHPSVRVGGVVSADAEEPSFPEGWLSTAELAKLHGVTPRTLVKRRAAGLAVPEPVTYGPRDSLRWDPETVFLDPDVSGPRNWRQMNLTERCVHMLGGSTVAKALGVTLAVVGVWRDKGAPEWARPRLSELLTEVRLVARQRSNGEVVPVWVNDAVDERLLEEVG